MLWSTSNDHDDDDDAETGGRDWDKYCVFLNFAFSTIRFQFCSVVVVGGTIQTRKSASMCVLCFAFRQPASSSPSVLISTRAQETHTSPNSIFRANGGCRPDAVRKSKGTEKKHTKLEDKLRKKSGQACSRIRCGVFVHN